MGSVLVEVTNMTDEKKVTVLFSPTHTLGIFQEMLSLAVLHFLLVAVAID